MNCWVMSQTIVPLYVVMNCTMIVELIIMDMNGNLISQDIHHHSGIILCTPCMYVYIAIATCHWAGEVEMWVGNGRKI